MSRIWLGQFVFFYEHGLKLPRMDSPPEVAFFPLNGTWLGLYSKVAMAADAGVESLAGSSMVLAHNVKSESEVDNVVAGAASAGGVVTRQPGATEWGGYSGYFRDPDGHLWEVAYNPFFGWGTKTLDLNLTLGSSLWFPTGEPDDSA